MNTMEETNNFRAFQLECEVRAAEQDIKELSKAITNLVSQNKCRLKLIEDLRK